MSNASLPSRPQSQSTPHGRKQSQPPAGSNAQLSQTRRTIYDQNLNRTRNSELSRASFAYLFSEMIVYAQRRATDIVDLEKRLNAQGYPLGLKLLDLLLFRSPTPFSSTTASAAQNLRPTRILPLLQFISTNLWRQLFGRPADALERSSEAKDEYMITDNDPLVNMYISVPKEMNMLNCAAYVAGIIEGVCDGCGFFAKVSAHSVGEEDSGSAGGQMWPGKTVFLVKFNEDVMEREEALGHEK